jgi:hypothetical protein
MTFENSIGKTVRALAGCLALALGLNPAFAANSSPRLAAYQLPENVVTEFERDPDAVLKRYEASALLLSDQVRNLVVSDSGTAPTLIGLCGAEANTKCGAIGAGIAEAITLIAPDDPKLSSDLQTLVLNSKSKDLVTAYLAVFSNVQTTSTVTIRLRSGQVVTVPVSP